MHCNIIKSFYFIFLLIYLFILQHCIVLPYTDLNLPWMYMCSPSWTPLPPSSPSHPSGSSQCTSPEHPVSCIDLDWRFISHMIIYMFQRHSTISSHPHPLPQMYKTVFKERQGLPWWLRDKESNWQFRNHGFNLWSRKIPHAMEQLGPCASTIELVIYSPRAATTEPMCYNSWSPRDLEPMLATRKASTMRSLHIAIRE